MKAIRYSVVTLMCGMLVLIGLSCGGDDDDNNAPIFQIPTSPLTAKQGPNKNVIEPNQVITTGPTGNFIAMAPADQAAKQLELITAILAGTNPQVGSGSGALPDQTLVSAILLGLAMGNVAADPAVTTATACSTEWPAKLVARTTGTCAARATYTTNCSITSKASGTLDLNFGALAAADCRYNFPTLLGTENEFGALHIYGELRAPSYPNSLDLNDTVCANTPTVACKDVWVTATSSNWGSGADNLTALSAVSAYIFNFDINAAAPDLGNEPIYMVSNFQINTTPATNVALVNRIPLGLNNVSNMSNDLIDSSGVLWNFALGASHNPPGNLGSRIEIYSFPVEVGGLCLSVFDTANGLISENPADYIYYATDSDNTCGL